MFFFSLCCTVPQWRSFFTSLFVFAFIIHKYAFVWNIFRCKLQGLRVRDYFMFWLKIAFSLNRKLRFDENMVGISPGSPLFIAFLRIFQINVNQWWMVLCLQQRRKYNGNEPINDEFNYKINIVYTSSSFKLVTKEQRWKDGKSEMHCILSIERRTSWILEQLNTKHKLSFTNHKTIDEFLWNTYNKQHLQMNSLNRHK